MSALLIVIAVAVLVFLALYLFFPEQLLAASARLEELRLRVAAHPLFPNRKIAYGLVSGLVTSAALKLGLDLNDPWVAYAAPLIVGYIISWLVTDGAAVERHTDERTIEAEEKASASAPRD